MEVNKTNGGGIAPSEFNGRSEIAADAAHAIEVDDVSFAVKEGEIVGLLGPNGAGKSTLIRMMTTLIPITAGKVRVEGHDVARDPDAVRRTVWGVSQGPTRALDLTVEEN